MDVKHKSTDHLFRVAGLEKKACMSLDESITIRSELLRKEEESAWIIELSSYEKREVCGGGPDSTTWSVIFS